MTLLTTLIPAYKPDFLGDVFVGLARQSLRDFRVILSDDSPGDEITRLIRNGHYGPAVNQLNLTVVRGPKNARRNHEQLLDLWAEHTPLVHLHLDDDIVFPEFYRSHAAVHAAGNWCASVSRRWLSQADGQPGWSLPLPDFVSGSAQRVVTVDAGQLFASTVGVCSNWLGELSNMVLSAEGAKRYPRPPRDAMSYYGLLDIGTLLEGVQQAPVAFLHDHLGVFRQHPQQTTHHVRHHGGRIAFLAWVAYALAAWHEGRIPAPQAAQAIGTAMQRALQQLDGDPVVTEALLIIEGHASDMRALHRAFSRFWLALLASHPATAAAPLPAPAAAAVGMPAAMAAA